MSVASVGDIPQFVDLLKLFQSIEELLYELALWLILLPKTLIKVVINPRWAYAYVVAEWEKAIADRFDEYMSPFFFWLVVGVIPYLLDMEWISRRLAYDQGTTPEHTNLLRVSCLFLGGPLGFALSIQKAHGTSIGRKSLKRCFYTQCLCFGPLNLFVFPLFAWTSWAVSQPWPKVFQTGDWHALCPWCPYSRIGIYGMVAVHAVAVAAFVWWLVAEAIIVTAELPVLSSGKALAVFLLGIPLSYLLFLVGALLVGLIWNLLS